MKLLFIFLTTLFAQANTHYAEGNYAEAAKQYEQILTETPSAEVARRIGPSDTIIRACLAFGAIDERCEAQPAVCTIAHCG